MLPIISAKNKNFIKHPEIKEKYRTHKFKEFIRGLRKEEKKEENNKHCQVKSDYL